MVQISGLFFIDSLNGWMGSPKYFGIPIPSIYKTTTGGQNWTGMFHSTFNNSYSIFFTDINKGWSAGDYGLIWHTSNSGLNWTQQTPVVNNRIYRSIYFTDSLTGWCVGDSGRILKTTTGGILTNFTNTNSEIPTEYKLDQNYPNPFNPKTIINYELGITNYVSLKVYDVLGNEIAALVNEKKSAGSYSFVFDGNNIPSGIYFYRLEVDGKIIDTKRMVILK
ncbi:MAG: T9SS type A sorting domain-containing protein [bacterium]|nr:T9SS type A sorting domain-containing protein [bacterium]